MKQILENKLTEEAKKNKSLVKKLDKHYRLEMDNLVIDYLSEDFVNNILYKSMVNEMVMFHDDQKIAKQS